MISKISFGNKTTYVHEGAIFARKEAEKVVKTMNEAIQQDRALRLISRDADKTHSYIRPDGLIPIPPAQPNNDRQIIESYVLSHGGPKDASTIAIA